MSIMAACKGLSVPAVDLVTSFGIPVQLYVASWCIVYVKLENQLLPPPCKQEIFAHVKVHTWWDFSIL